MPEKDRVVGHADILYVFVNHGLEGLEQLGMTQEGTTKPNKTDQVNKDHQPP